MAALTVNGAEIEFRDEGEGEPAFVFIHGWACNMSAWAPQVEDLSRDHRCIAVNLRGRGASQALPPFDTTQAADDVAGLMRERGVGAAVVVGHSLGGMVALLLNDRHPDLVLGLVLGDSPLDAARSGRFESTSQAVAAAGSMSPMAEFLETFFTEETSEELRDEVREMMLTCPGEVAAGMLSNGQMFSDRIEELIRSADQKPFMAIWANSPLGDPDWLRDITTFVRQEPMVGAGHFFQLERPQVTNALLRAFLDDIERDPRIAN